MCFVVYAFCCILILCVCVVSMCEHVCVRVCVCIYTCVCMVQRFKGSFSRDLNRVLAIHRQNHIKS